MDSLRLYLVTWNVACKPPEQNLSELLSLDEPEEKLPDFYVVGLQEVKAQIHNMVLDALFDDPWTIAFKQQLIPKNYVKVKTVRLQGIILSIYCKRKHLLSVRDVEVQYTKTGFSGFWGNKGCVAIRMNVYGVSVCFVNTHLTAHDQNLFARVQDYNNIIKQTNFSNQKETTLILYHDYVFWVGDHNFRLDETVQHDDILDKIKINDLDELRESDQLRMIMKSGQAFSELVEEPFDFPPTYKFIFNSSQYDAKRRPAWTDRILYKVNTHAYENLTLSAKMQFYKCFSDYIISDHKPVAGKFIFKVFSNYSDRIIEFEPIKKWYIDEENTVTITPGDDVLVSDWDWIGVYKADYGALDEYLSFVYINSYRSATPESASSPRPPEGTTITRHRLHRKEIKFPDGMVRTAGQYCLLYLTADSGSVLGISSPFEATFKSGSYCVYPSF
ncbi:UNVERIFIED_CONTAM: hypothetical protein PYX00_005278 [Menopon gallinae]|uniref:Inositol polyphosphate-related phosphatase domain-containing protein n=1 Tax=Menopon gallinae TaxID=328185 RepID=A0AAW2HRK6_9NEOP